MTSYLIPLCIILIAGMPHGAADGALAIRQYGDNLKRLGFFMAYIVVALLALAVWYIAPTFALGLFLVLTVLHFGTADVRAYGYRGSHTLPIIAHGSTVLVFMSLGQAEILEKLLSQLILNNHSEWFVLTLQWLALPWLIAATYSMIQVKQRLNLLVEFGIIISVSLLLHPLWSFCLYFCGIHSVRHFKTILPTVMQSGVTKALTILFSVLGVAIAGAIFYFFQDIAVDTALLRATVITLFMLTIPHMIFIDYIQPINLAIRGK